MPQPIHALPDGYVEVEHLAVTDGRRLLWLNVLAFVPGLISFVIIALWLFLALDVHMRVTPRTGSILPVLPGVFILLMILLVHELIHAVGIRWVGHTPRMGIVKGALYVTADDALFPRDTFIVIALAPLVVITVVGMVVIWLSPIVLGVWAAGAVVFNATGAIGDLWMVAAVRRYPAEVLVRDEKNGIRIYAVSESR